MPLPCPVLILSLFETVSDWYFPYLIKLTLTVTGRLVCLKMAKTTKTAQKLEMERITIYFIKKTLDLDLAAVNSWTV